MMLLNMRHRSFLIHCKVNIHLKMFSARKSSEKTSQKKLTIPKLSHLTGDSSNGTHTVRLPHDKYPRDIIPPKLIAIEINHKKSSDSYFIFNFRATRILEKNSNKFDDELLFDLNLLQENLGKCGVENADKPISTYADTLIVSWDIFPPCSKEEILARIFKGKT